MRLFSQLSEKDFNVLTKVASKPDTLYSKYECVFELYSQFRLKGQKYKSTDVRGENPNVPLYLFCRLFHLEDDDAAETTILDQVADTKLSIQDLGKVAGDIAHLEGHSGSSDGCPINGAIGKRLRNVIPSTLNGKFF